MRYQNLYLAIGCLSLVSGVFAQGQSTQTIQIAGVARTYVQYVPTGVSNPPLVYVIHGFNMTGPQEVSLTRMNTVADRGKFIVVYPNALKDTANQPSWDMSGPNDYAFLLAIIDTVDAKYHIDRNRIYASGFSQGGFLSFQLGCRYANKFAAIAPVSGLQTGTCKPSRAIPVFLTFGTADVATPASFMSSVSTWLQLDSCPTTPVVTRPYPATNANSVVTRLDYSPCKNGTEIIADSVQGGPHEWPMDTKTKVNNSDEVWAFFSKFSLANNTGISGKTSPSSQKNISANYASGVIFLQGLSGNEVIRILDNAGRVILESSGGRPEINFYDQPHGVYHVIVNKPGHRVSLRLVVL